MTGVMRRAVKGWLKAGVMEGKDLFPTEEGTPQGGVISPLLANIALHGMENAIAERWPNVNNRPKIVRYADDLVTIHVELSIVIECVELLNEWLAEGGLQLHPDKTRIVHTLNEHNGQPPGFNFLGVHFRQFRMGKRHNKNKWGHKTIISPSIKSQKRHAHNLKEQIRKMRGVSQEAVIFRLNPKIILGATTSNHLCPRLYLTEWTSKCTKDYGTGPEGVMETKVVSGSPRNTGD